MRCIRTVAILGSFIRSNTPFIIMHCTYRSLLVTSHDRDLANLKRSVAYAKPTYRALWLDVFPFTQALRDVRTHTCAESQTASTEDQ